MGVGIERLAANTELLVSELVTNAVKTTAGNNDQAAICLQLSGDNTRVLIEVWDADPQPPVLKDLGEDGTPDPQEEGGRGLCLIAALIRDPDVLHRLRDRLRDLSQPDPQRRGCTALTS